MDGLALPVAGLPGDGQRLLVQLDGRWGLAEADVAQAEVAKLRGLAIPVANHPVDGQRLLIQLNSPGELAEQVVAGAEAVLAGGAGSRVVDVALQPFVQPGGQPVVAPLE